MSGPELGRARWFERLGLPLEHGERAQFSALAIGSQTQSGIEFAVVESWHDVLRILEAEERDNRQWDAGEEERERMWEIATLRYSESELLAQLHEAGEKWHSSVHAAAIATARRIPIADGRFASAAAGAALLAVNHSALARLVDADAAHPFHRTLELFARGRWPLGFSAGRYLLF